MQKVTTDPSKHSHLHYTHFLDFMLLDNQTHYDTTSVAQLLFDNIYLLSKI
uniref:Uncharacterized protein n=1 Tax=Rhizophora mucronata TaxID=61149 RepID=A0A2P2QTI4_RHIMU